MTNFKIQIAGKIVEITTIFDTAKTYCSDYVVDGECDFSLEITQSDISFERMKSEREEKIERLLPRNLSDEYLEITAVQRKIAEKMFSYDTLLFHGSVIAVDGVAYLFTAKSGTGKSTHTRLWREMLGDRAIMVNDDKPFLTITDEGVIAHGSPWNGKHRLGSNISVPLRAICILERGETNKIEPISPSKAVHMLIQQSSRPRNVDLVPKYMELLDALTKRVKFYRLACNMNPEAAEIAFSAMSS